MTYQHDLSSSAALEIEDGGVEVRLAVMQSQFGWGAYAVNVNAGQGNGWGGTMGRRSRQRSGRCWGTWRAEWRAHLEHTVRVSPTQGVPYINGIDGVAGMQYLIN